MAGLGLDRIGKRFGAVQALQDISFAVPAGTVLVLTGPPGSGRGALLRLIAGLDRPSTGVIRLEGQDITTLPPDRRGLAKVFWTGAFAPHRSLQALFAFALRPLNLPGAEAERRSVAIAGKLGLADQLARDPATLSRPQRLRAALGRALLRDPSGLLVPDLPPELPEAEAADLAALTLHLAKAEGRTLIATADPGSAMAMAADLMAVLQAGRLHQIAPPETLFRDPETLIVARYLTRPGLNLCPARVAAFGLIEVPALARDLASSAALPGLGGQVLAALHPEDLVPIAGESHLVVQQGVQGWLRHLHLQAPDGSRILLALPLDQPAPGPGQRCALQVVPGRLMIFAADGSGRRLH